MRTIKTLTSVAILLVLGQLLNQPAPMYACVAAILAMRDTVENSISFGLVRILSAIVGGAVAVLVLFVDVRGISPYLHILVILIGSLITIYFTVLIKQPDATAAAMVTFLIIALAHMDDKYAHALRRVAETVVGIVVAVLINKFMNFNGWGKKKPHQDEDKPVL